MLVPAALILALAAPAGSTPARDAAASPAPGKTVRVGSLEARLPAGWVEETPASPMRKAQYRLPRAAGDGEDAALVVFNFGSQAGTVEANLDRWLGQMKQPDGKPSRDAARIEKRLVAGMKLTILDVSGRFVAEMRPGSGEAQDRPGWRMIAAVVEARDGAYYFKLTGPEKTVANHARAMDGFLSSLVPAATAN